MQRAGLLRVALRDLLGVIDTPTASRELSDLADGIIAAALDHVHPPDSATRVAVVAMGKLGGRELNYVSDVDVVFVHDGDNNDALTAAKALLALVGLTTPDGTTYQLDPTLRPEGRDGALSRTLTAYDGYYGRWAEHWEFQALLKARPVGGDPTLGAAFAAMATGHVWSDRLGLEGVDAIQRMKAVVESSRAVRRDGTRQLKLAPGGLRDIEFAAQLLQLVHGKVDATLRGPGTLDALAALAEGGYVDEGDANLFADAYHFLRTVEHRLQLRRLRRTHTVPAEDRERRRLARAVGFRDLATRTALEQFDREYARVQAAVRRLHQQLFYRPLLGRIAGWSPEDRAPIPGPEGQLEQAAARRRLEALGFAAPGKALEHLKALGDGVGRSARLLRALLPAMLEQLAESPDPDGGLVGPARRRRPPGHQPGLPAPAARRAARRGAAGRGPGCQPTAGGVVRPPARRPEPAGRPRRARRAATGRGLPRDGRGPHPPRAGGEAGREATPCGASAAARPCAPPSAS